MLQPYCERVETGEIELAKEGVQCSICNVVRYEHCRLAKKGRLCFSCFLVEAKEERKELDVAVSEDEDKEVCTDWRHGCGYIENSDERGGGEEGTVPDNIHATKVCWPTV